MSGIRVGSSHYLASNPKAVCVSHLCKLNLIQVKGLVSLTLRKVNLVSKIFLPFPSG